MGVSPQASPGRRLSFTNIAGYMPGSKVTQHNAVDMDQAAMQTAIAVKTAAGFAAGESIYRNGGHSKSYAEFTIPAAVNAIAADTAVSGFALDGVTALTGTVKSSVAVSGTILKVVYFSSETQSRVPSCAAGGLPATSHIISQTGCFHATGPLSIAAQTGIAAHTINPDSYDPVTDTKAGRTLRGFSTGAGSKMRTGCPGCPYTDFIKAYEYYGVDDYSDRWVIGALTATKVDFNGPNGRGSADFSTTNDGDTRVEAAKKGAAYMGTWMYVVREFEDAIDDCVDGAINRNDDPVHAWDEGVAFYTGTFTQAALAPGGTGSGTTGMMPYTLAEKRCQNFKTCGQAGDTSTGTSQVNIELFRLFALAQYSLQMGQCADVRPLLHQITALMTVPLIQGTLRYANAAKRIDPKGKAEGATFAAALLPRLHSCSPADAAIVYDHMKIGSTEADPYAAVQAAIRGVGNANLYCMNVTCAHVGGLTVGGSANEAYISGAEPCLDPAPPSGLGLTDGERAGVIVGALIGGLAILFLFMCVCCMVKKEKAGKPLFTTMNAA